MKKNRGLAREALRFVRAAESQNYVLHHPAAGQLSKTNSPWHSRHSGPARRGKREPKIPGLRRANLLNSPPPETRYVLWMEF